MCNLKTANTFSLKYNMNIQMTTTPMNESFSDVTDAPWIPRDSLSGPLFVVRVALMTLCGILAIGLNIFNLAVIRFVRCFQDATKAFLMVLAVVDLSSGCLTIITENVTYWTNMTTNAFYFCEITLTTSGFLMLSSLFILSCLSIDRFLAITKPLRYPNLMTNKSAVVLATLALCLACLSSVAVMSRKAPLDNVSFDNVTKFCSIRRFDSKIQFALAFGGTISIVMIICTTVINAKLLWVALKQGRRNRAVIVQPSAMTVVMDNVTGKSLETETIVNIHTSSKWEETKALRTVLTMTCALYVAYLPLTIHITRYAAGLKPFDKVYEFFAFLMIYCNAWFNPLIYLFSNKGYRKTARKIWKRYVSAMK